MHEIKFDLFPGGKRKAVTFSYDDGQIYDKRLADIFNKYGVKCTFNLNSGTIGQRGYVEASFVRELSNNHEIACHTVTHPHLENIPTARIISEVYDDKRALENIIGKPVCGMAYPFGTFNEDIKKVLRTAGILYSRITGAKDKFTFPCDFLEWQPNCHHRAATEKAKQFVEIEGDMSLLYIWGHSFEFDRENNWNVIEEIMHIVAGRNDIWYATNMQLYDYYHAVKSLRVSSDGKAVYNPSALTVFATLNGKPEELAPGLTQTDND